MEFSLNQSSGEMNHWCQGYYPAYSLDYLGKRGERKEHTAEEEHRCDKEGEIVVKAVKGWNKRGKDDSDRGEHYAGQKGKHGYEQCPW